jgi:hypothetical protein
MGGNISRDTRRSNRKRAPLECWSLVLVIDYMHCHGDKYGCKPQLEIVESMSWERIKRLRLREISDGVIKRKFFILCYVQYHSRYFKLLQDRMSSS